MNIDIAARLVVSSADARIIFFSGGDDLARSVNVQGRMLIFLSQPQPIPFLQVSVAVNRLNVFLFMCFPPL